MTRNIIPAFAAAAIACCIVSGAPVIVRLPNTTLQIPITSTESFPPTLAETGALADLATLAPQPGIVPFEINVALWSDGAHKTRWFSLPDTTQTIGFSRDGFWTYPTGMVWIKHFELELTNGVPESARRLETRFLVRTVDGIAAATYRWDDSQTNALLVPAQGMDEPLLIHEPDGAVRSQVWHYPSRQECRTCHNAASGYALGFNTPQLNCDLELEREKKPKHKAHHRERGHGRGHGHGHGRADGHTKLINQIVALSDAGYFEAKVTNVHTLRALVPADNTEVSVEYRVRSYLTANCVHCHQPGAPCGFTLWNARITNSLPQTGLINGRALMNFGDPENRVVAPGRPEKSVLFTRVATLGPHHMPVLCTSVLNTNGMELLRTWIAEELAGYQSYADWQLTHFGSTNHPYGAARADADGDGAPNYLEYLTGGNPLLATDGWRLSIRPTGRGMEIRFPRAANRGYEVEWTHNLGAPNSWQALDVPGNKPFFAAAPSEAIVVDPDRDANARFYRIRVYEP